MHLCLSTYNTFKTLHVNKFLLRPASLPICSAENRLALTAIGTIQKRTHSTKTTLKLVQGWHSQLTLKYNPWKWPFASEWELSRHLASFQALRPSHSTQQQQLTDCCCVSKATACKQSCKRKRAQLTPTCATRSMCPARALLLYKYTCVVVCSLQPCVHLSYREAPCLIPGLFFNRCQKA